MADTADAPLPKRPTPDLDRDVEPNPAPARPAEPNLLDMTIDEFERTIVATPAALRAQEWTVEALERLINELALQWQLDRDGMRPCLTTTWACELFGVAENDLSLVSNAITTDHPAHIHRRILSKIGVVSTLLELVHHETFVPDQSDADHMTQQLGEVACVMSNAADLLRSACRLMCSLTADPNAADPYVLGNRFLHLIQETRMTPLQSLLMEVSMVLLRNGWRQYEGRYYIPITVCVDGEIYETHAWEDRATVEEMITSLCNCNLEHRRWLYLTSGRDITRQAANHLIAGGPHSFEFPTLEFDRQLFAFSDGVYDGKTDTFFPHAERGLAADRVAIKYFDHPMDAEMPRPDPPAGYRLRWAHQPVDSDFMFSHSEDLVAALLPLTTAEGDDLRIELLDCLGDSWTGSAGMERTASVDEWVNRWLSRPVVTAWLVARDKQGRRRLVDVQQVSCAVWARHPASVHLCYQTPRLDQILFTQDFDMGTASLLYAMVGRLMYDVGELDGWQIIPFILGKGGSGKSTIIRLVRHMYPASCVANISSNGETKFGLSGVYGKFIWLCPEVKKKFALDQGEFQSMISGEEIVLNVKNVTARTVQWVSPGMMCGNEVFNFEDTQESLFRRIVAIYFDKMVDKRSVDTTLYDDMIGGDDPEFGRFLRKCNVAYRNMCGDVGKRNFWDPSLVEQGIVPARMHGFRTQFRTEIDSVVAFIETFDELHQDETKCMSVKGFVSILSEWIRDNDTAGKGMPGITQLRDRLEALGYVIQTGELPGVLYSDPECFANGGRACPVPKNKEVIVGLYFEPYAFVAGAVGPAGAAGEAAAAAEADQDDWGQP
jgi:hypothetical protein